LWVFFKNFKGSSMVLKEGTAFAIISFFERQHVILVLEVVGSYVSASF
jgi:uncharacterized Zn ribbon protein